MPKFELGECEIANCVNVVTVDTSDVDVTTPLNHTPSIPAHVMIPGTPTKINTPPLIGDSPSALIGPLTITSLLGNSPLDPVDSDGCFNWTVYEEQVLTATRLVAKEPLEGGYVETTPRKDSVALVPTSPAHSPEAGNNMTLTPLVKKRGRPYKNPLVANSNNKPIQPRRKRGRPPKNKCPLMFDPFGKVVKKKGRPRKNKSQVTVKMEKCDFPLTRPCHLVHKSAVRDDQNKEAAQLITR